MKKMNITTVGGKVRKIDILAALKRVLAEDLSDQYEIYDMGWDSASYFPGFGTSGTDFDEALYEVGSSARDAVENLLQRIYEMNITDTLKDAIAADLKASLAKAKDADEMSLVGIRGSFKANGMNLTLKSVEGESGGFGVDSVVSVDVDGGADGGEVHFSAVAPSGESAGEELIRKLEDEGYQVSAADEEKIMREALSGDDNDFYYHIGVKAKSGG